MRFIHWYNLSFKINPFTTIITSNGIIYGGGDVLMQYIDIIKGRTTIVDGQIVPIRYDYKRTIRQTIFGMFIYSPINFVWYNNLLPKIMKTSNPPKLLECFKKMAFGIYNIYILFFFNLKQCKFHIYYFETNQTK